MNSKSCVKTNILFFILVHMFMFLSCNTVPVTPFAINDPESSYPLVSSSYYYIDHENLSLREISTKPESEWERAVMDQKHFGIGTEIIWFRIDINNFSGQQKWHLVSEYAFIDKITLYYFDNTNELITISDGISVPVSNRMIRHRLTVLPLELLPNKNRLWIRIESGFENKIGLTLEPPGLIAQRDRFPFNLYWEYVRLAAIIAVISIMFALFFRNRLFFIYLAYLVTLTFYLGTWEGYVLFYMYPENPGWNNHLHYGIGFLFGVLLIIFWKRLLTLSVQMPWFNRIMNILAGVALACSAYGFTPFAVFAFLGIMARLITLALVVIAFIAGLRIVVLGQKYAVFMVLGCIFFFMSMCIFLFSGMWIIPGNNFTKNAIYLGFVLELVVLIISLLYRVRFINQLRTEKVMTQEPKRSRIRNYDLRSLVSALNTLMSEEKLFNNANISQEQLSAKLAVTRHQLSELIREVYDTNFYGFINDLRINEAKMLLLKDRRLSVLSVAMAVGYNSKSTFNQAFKKITGITPSEFRYLEKQGPED